MIFYPNNQNFIIGGEDGSIRIYDLSYEQTSILFEHTSPVTALAFTKNSLYFLSGS
jgi:WD40 repeat protein